jgi:hypothetical protein
MRAKAKKPVGSPTNAKNEAVDDLTLPPKPSTEEVVDHGVQESFPASDPVAVGSAHHKAAKREEKEQEIHPKRREPPDWLLHPPRR